VVAGLFLKSGYQIPKLVSVAHLAKKVLINKDFFVTV